MSIFLAIVGILAWLFAGVALASVFSGGTDIQLTAAGVYGTFGAVCIGIGAMLDELKAINKSLRGDRAPGERYGPSGERLA